ncbi:hypothetical protein NT04LS_0201, partial [Listeria seeligeri FSL S4-171]
MVNSVNPDKGLISLILFEFKNILNPVGFGKFEKRP